MIETYAERMTGMMDLVSTWAVVLGMPAEIEMSEQAIENTRSQIQRCVQFCKEIELPVSAESFHQLELNFSVNPENGWPRDQHYHFRNVRQCLQSEMKDRKIIFINSKYKDIYNNKNAFGELVSLKFKDSKNDIRDAGNCLALGQSTACVMHLMRAMEVAITSLSKKLRIVRLPRDTIGTILSKMTPKIDAMPQNTFAKKSKKERWSEVRTHLYHVKLAWRDNSMHATKEYSDPHAEEIYRAVKSFMFHLASL